MKNPQSAIRNPQSVVWIVFSLMLLVSWRRWTSPIADSGREMDLPLRLLRGEMLYRDVHHIYPPLSPYFNALLYRVFGVHLDVLLLGGVLFSAIIVLLSLRISRRVLPEAEAALAAAAVVVLCVFKPAGNLISPYSFAALYGTALAMGTLLIMLRYGESERRRELVMAGALVGLAAVTKQEFAAAAAITTAATLLFIHRRDFGLMIGRLMTVALIAAAIALPVYGFFLWRVGWQTLINDCHLLYTRLPPSLVYYNRQRTGLDHPLSSLLQMAGGAAVAVAAAGGIILLAVISSLLVRHLDQAAKNGSAAELQMLWRRCLVVLTIATACVFFIKAAAQGRWDGSPLRALPLGLAGLILFSWRRGLQQEFNPAAATRRALFIIAVYSLAVLARVALRVPSGGAFGGFFLPTSLILIVYLTARALPRLVEDWTLNQRLATRVRTVGRGTLALLLVTTMAVFAARYQKNFDVEINAPHGKLYAPRSSGAAISEALDFIRANTAPGEAIAVVPEGSDLAFLSGRRMPLRHQIMIPDFMSEQGEREAIATLERERVRYVFIVNRPMREFGREAFGRDYDQTLGQWINEHYRPVRVCGVMRDSPPDRLEIGDPNFFIKVYAPAETK
ncbi:MAG TPA: glycosyltransferase family 39 protein [Blastocatellia bacterium]|nr:glycosyltransferase family 39 protein [Blastocatellia bacterium]